MRHEGIANPEQLSILGKVLDVYCQRAGIVADSPERRDIAARILLFYDLGFDTEDGLADALEGWVGNVRKRVVTR
jgi:hypothetical protein